MRALKEAMNDLKKFVDAIAGSVLTEGIKHIEDLKPQALLDFLSNWNLDKKNFHVSEKVDGNFFGFGLENGVFYVRSKNRKWGSAEEISNLFFMQSFKDYFRLLQNIPLNDIITQLAGQYQFTFNGSIDIGGEAIPSYDHNIVIYDEKKIGDGIFVIFDTAIEGKSFNNPNFWIDLAKEMNKHTSVKVYAVPEVDLSKLEFNNDLVVSLEDIINTHGNFLKKPARKPEEKELKQKLLAAVKEIGMSAKQQVLQTKFKSLFGDEYEGLVLAAPDGSLVKIVEKDKFKARKEQNWYFIDKLIAAQRDFKKAVKADAQGIKKELVKWERELARIKTDYSKNKDSHITIPKKGEDTEKSIDLDGKVIQLMKDMLADTTPEEVVKKYFNKEIVPNEAREATLPLLKEGGNVFEAVNSAVPRELLDVNIKHALQQAGFGDLKYELVGNVNKKFLGDIDIAVDKNQMMQTYGFSEEDFWTQLESLIKTDHKIIKNLKQFHLMTELVDKTGKQIPAISATGEQQSGEPGFIQIDIFVGNLGWMKSVVSGAPVESKYKAVYRNLLLISAFAIIRWPKKSDPTVYNKLTLDAKEGFKLVQKQMAGSSTKRDKKVSEKLFSVDPDVVTQILFNKSVKWPDVESFEKLWALFDSEQFRFKKFRPQIIEEFKTSLVRSKKELPSELS